ASSIIITRTINRQNIRLVAIVTRLVARVQINDRKPAMRHRQPSSIVKMTSIPVRAAMAKRFDHFFCRFSVIWAYPGFPISCNTAHKLSLLFRPFLNLINRVRLSYGYFLLRQAIKSVKHRYEESLPYKHGTMRLREVKVMMCLVEFG